MNPTMNVETMMGLALEGVAKFGANAELYIRPMYWPEESGSSAIVPDAELDALLHVHLRGADAEAAGRSAVTLSPFRRPTIENAPVNAKAGCLYPNNARAMREARTRNFDNCLLADMLGNIAELATANIFMAKDGVVFTPIPNGTFLNGITRQRVVKLLRRIRTAGRRGHPDLCRFPGCGRDLLGGQLRQGRSR